ncbi:MAG: hypothetical protein J1E40_04535, partial [Oscillospiraceae bacterium]|nr:hypothetical protein [Oscillospiraceae bacterium]
ILGVPNNIGGYENFEFQAYANAIGAMFRSNKDTERINLIEIDSATGRSGAGASFFAAVIGAAAVSAAVVGAVWLFGNIQVNDFNRQAADIQAYLDSPEVAAQIAAVDDAEAKLTRVNNVKYFIDTAVTNYESLPVLTRQTFDDVEANFRGTSAVLRSISYSNGAITIQVHCDRSDEPAKVVGNFIEQDIFDNVTYTGFNQTSTELNAIVYQFDVTFVVREIEPEENEPAEEDTAEVTE